MSAQYGKKRRSGLPGDETAPDAVRVRQREDACLAALRLLTARAYTEQRLREKLAGKGYPAGEIDTALQYVKSYHYVDDESYATAFAASQIHRRSRARILQDLLRRGVDRDICLRALDEAYEDAGKLYGNRQEAGSKTITPADTFETAGGTQRLIEEELAVRLLRKYRYHDTEADAREKNRIYARLRRKGFSHEVTVSAMVSTVCSASAVFTDSPH